jgi:hypothetical protein
LLENRLLDALGIQFRGFDVRAQIRRCSCDVCVLPQIDCLQTAARGAQRAHNVVMP